MSCLLLGIRLSGAALANDPNAVTEAIDGAKDCAESIYDGFKGVDETAQAAEAIDEGEESVEIARVMWVVIQDGQVVMQGEIAFGDA